MANQKNISQPVIKDALSRELNLAQSALSYHQNTLRPLEKKFGLAFDKFIAAFEKGKVGDSEEAFDFYAYARFASYWQESARVLKVLL